MTRKARDTYTGCSVRALRICPPQWQRQTHLRRGHKAVPDVDGVLACERRPLIDHVAGMTDHSTSEKARERARGLNRASSSEREQLDLTETQSDCRR